MILLLEVGEVKNEKRATFVALSLVGLPGLEPGKAGPESAVLPLHHSPMFWSETRLFLISECKGTAFF